MKAMAMNQQNPECPRDFAPADLRYGSFYEREGKRYFVRLWPDPVVLVERLPGVWADTHAFEADFNLTHQRATLARLTERSGPLLPELSAHIAEERRPHAAALAAPREAMRDIQRRIAEREHILSVIPGDVLQAVQRFPGQHLRLLRFAALGSDAMQMMDSNPALAYLMAVRRRRQRRTRSILDCKNRELLRLRRTEILRALGVPDSSPAAVRLLGKVEARHCTPETVGALRRILANAAQALRTRHLRRISPGVAAIIADPALSERVTNAFLERLSLGGPGDRQAVAARYLRRFINVSKGRIEAGRVFNSPEKLWYTMLGHVDLLCSDDLMGLNMPFPDPPVPDTPACQALRTPQDMIDEADEQNNCLVTHIPNAAMGRLVFYRVLAPERATLSLRRRAGKWEIAELEGPGNEPVFPETEDYIRRWLWSCSRD